MSNIFQMHDFVTVSSSIDLLPVNPAQWAPWIILIGLTFSLFFLSSVVCKKTGLPTSKATICLLPIIGPFIFFWSLAFSAWPIHEKLPEEEEEENKKSKKNKRGRKA
ncbi:hypothetical protein LNTAR_18580 [Lentisphaera araneosa HTCC2155]|uniref:Uncharacterized protein n=1 Tax=Lentisphaera araneosa HTCC2155 TaxID=313628 RepID=A6DNM2_9BACT|nr:hypothetical protein [Lentisphaera araneosa]EDM26681.1 hypothetical protein LNTAR_18580 [Lentisphaera araneosa HTCC2155]